MDFGFKMCAYFEFFVVVYGETFDDRVEAMIARELSRLPDRS